MNLENENSVHNVDARLIKQLRQLSFKNECLVFTGNVQGAKQTLESEINSKERRSVGITTHIDDLKTFLNFEK
jgi:hypothetical protein